MPTNDHPPAGSQPKVRGPIRGRWILITALVAASLLLAVLVTRDDDGAAEATRTDLSVPPASSQTTTNFDPQTELVTRLREILSQREEAYRKRDPEILKNIYTVDCPCLESDSKAIRELLSKGYIWVGGQTSIRARRMERVTNRMWIVVATFDSESLRIETESGRLVRTEPRGSDLFQFVLAKPAGSNQWLLGRASSYKDG
jgi:hypothetical protein